MCKKGFFENLSGEQWAVICLVIVIGLVIAIGYSKKGQEPKDPHEEMYGEWEFYGIYDEDMTLSDSPEVDEKLEKYLKEKVFKDRERPDYFDEMPLYWHPWLHKGLESGNGRLISPKYKAYQIIPVESLEGFDGLVEKLNKTITINENGLTNIINTYDSEQIVETEYINDKEFYHLIKTPYIQQGEELTNTISVFLVDDYIFVDATIPKDTILKYSEIGEKYFNEYCLGRMFVYKKKR